MGTMNWIPTSARLPDAEILVLIALSDGEVWPAYLDGDTWRYVDAMPVEPGCVTHWMDLPEHPETDSRASANRSIKPETDSRASANRSIKTREEPMRFIGTKIIIAEAMSRAAYNAFRGWMVPADENGADEGYLVEYQDGGKPNVPGRAGYVSWSPKEQFDNAYRPCEAMTFGLALEALKRGAKVARTGWNGKGMWLILVPGTPTADLREGTPYAKALQQPACEILPHIDMWTVNAEGRRAMLPGWLASQSDMLAEDWLIVV